MSETLVIDSSKNGRSYFGTVPHMAGAKLDVYEHRLYCHYIEVCGLSPWDKCTQAERTIYTACKMSKQRFIKARAGLANKGFITFRAGKPNKKGQKGYAALTTIPDIWEENIQFCKARPYTGQILPVEGVNNDPLKGSDITRSNKYKNLEKETTSSQQSATANSADSNPTCSCGKPLVSDTGDFVEYVLRGKLVCSDCYYDDYYGVDDSGHDDSKCVVCKNNMVAQYNVVVCRDCITAMFDTYDGSTTKVCRECLSCEDLTEMPKQGGQICVDCYDNACEVYGFDSGHDDKPLPQCGNYNSDCIFWWDNNECSSLDSVEPTSETCKHCGHEYKYDGTRSESSGIFECPKCHKCVDYITPTTSHDDKPICIMDNQQYRHHDNCLRLSEDRISLNCPTCAYFEDVISSSGHIYKNNMEQFPDCAGDTVFPDDKPTVADLVAATPKMTDSELLTEILVPAEQGAADWTKEPVEPKPEAKKKRKPAKKKAPSDHTLMKNAMLAAMGKVKEEITVWGDWNSASKKLRAVNAAPEDIPGLYNFVMRLSVSGNWSFKSPMTLAKYWPDYKKQLRETQTIVEQDESEPLDPSAGVVTFGGNDD